MLMFFACKNDTEEKNNHYKKYKAGIKEDTLKFSGFYFSAKAYGDLGIYYYNAASKKIKPYWWNTYDQVVDLQYSSDKQNIFFLTSRGSGIRGSLPFFEKLKLHRINPETKKVEFIKEIGNGLQVQSYWEKENIFIIIYTASDPLIAAYVNRVTQVYNQFGKMLEEKIEIFDLTTQGYPALPSPPLNYQSPSNYYSLFLDNDSLYIYQNDNKTKYFVQNHVSRIKNVEWLEKKDIVLLNSYVNPDSNKMNNVTSLSIFNLAYGKTVKRWQDKGLKRFMVIGNKLIFDNNFGTDSYLLLYDLEKSELFDSIKVRGGTGLRNIPSQEGIFL